MAKMFSQCDFTSLQVRSPQIKNARKQTGFKIQFYIGIHPSGIVFGSFSVLSAMSPSPNGEPS